MGTITDKDYLLEEIWDEGVAILKDASEDLRADKEVVMAAVKNTGRALEYASEDLQAEIIQS